MPEIRECHLLQSLTHSCQVAAVEWKKTFPLSLHLMLTSRHIRDSIRGSCVEHKPGFHYQEGVKSWGCLLDDPKCSCNPNKLWFIVTSESSLGAGQPTTLNTFCIIFYNLCHRFHHILTIFISYIPHSGFTKNKQLLCGSLHKGAKCVGS